MNKDISHAIKNDLQVVLWGLEPKAGEEARTNALAAVDVIVGRLDSGGETGIMDKAIEQLIKLAAEMGMRDGMPSEYANDWPIPKNTPHKTLYEIERNMEIIQKKIADWSYTARQIANGLHKDNKQ